MNDNEAAFLTFCAFFGLMMIMVVTECSHKERRDRLVSRCVERTELLEQCHKAFNH